MTKLWSLFLILLTLSLSAESLFSMHFEDSSHASAASASQSDCQDSVIAAHHAAPIEASHCPENTGHLCHVGHCPFVLHSTSVLDWIPLASESSAFSRARELYLSPATLGLLRPPARPRSV